MGNRILWRLTSLHKDNECDARKSYEYETHDYYSVEDG